MPTSHEIRQQFIDYFVKRHGHAMVPSSPVVPHDDPTLLFANAGMNQFKDMFLGTGHRDYCRAANTQKCIRAGGKHNDLEDVGKDTYHHTFFEMLGNWSFGDYFKEEAIAWAWDLLTNVWGLDKSRLHATVFAGDASESLEPDDEAAELWKRVTDIDPGHIHGGSKKDNFWEMGDTGPCGPCSEIHIDLTPDKSGGPLINAADPRVIEIWNLVFIQFNRAPGRDGQPGLLTPLPAKHVDTGMGFERVCAVLQGKASNYDTDVFAPIFGAIQAVTGAAPYGGRLDGSPEGQVDMAYRVIADHIRCLAFALTDGALPSNEGRGYVLRRILRRAVRHGWQTLGLKEPFLHRLVPTVVDTMGGVFPELAEQPQRVIDVIKDEEQSFAKTLDRGIALFHQAAQSGGQAIAAQDAFKLHDTYGFPLDLTQVMAQERGMAVDVEGFNQLMAEARQQARQGGKQQSSNAALVAYIQQHPLSATEFVGYDQTHVHETKVVAAGYIDPDHGVITDIDDPSDIRAFVVVNRTPFYAEAGGQVGDQGTIQNTKGVAFQVDDTVRIGDAVFHLGQYSGRGRIYPKGELVSLQVDQAWRKNTMANHTGTHLLNRALRDTLGDHVQQKGSLVDDQKLRFDFSHNAVVGVEQVDRIEQMVNHDIAADLPVYADEAAQEEALKINGLRAVFGEKYPPRVRVVSIGAPVNDLLADPTNAEWEHYSIEFCGGTHLPKTGDAQGFVVVSEEAVAKGVRRLTGLTGSVAHRAAAQGEMLLSRLASLQNQPADQLSDAIGQLTTEIEEKILPLLTKAKLRSGITQLQETVKAHHKAQNKQAADSVIEAARRLADEPSADGVMVASLEGADAAGLRLAMDVVRKKKPDNAVLLGAISGEKVAFVAAVPKALIDRGLKAGDWVREVAKVAGGGGGGRPDMAQAGGKDPQKLDEALQAGRVFAESKLSKG